MNASLCSVFSEPGPFPPDVLGQRVGYIRVLESVQCSNSLFNPINQTIGRGTRRNNTNVTDHFVFISLTEPIIDGVWYRCHFTHTRTHMHKPQIFTELFQARKYWQEKKTLSHTSLLNQTVADPGI